MLSTIQGNTDVYLVTGDTVEQVRTPEVYKLLFGKLGINAVRVPVHVVTNNIETFAKNAILVKSIKGMSAGSKRCHFSPAASVPGRHDRRDQAIWRSCFNLSNRTRNPLIFNPEETTMKKCFAPKLVAVYAIFTDAGAGFAQDISNISNIANIVELSGDCATAGTNFKNGVELAVREINASGGILGKKIQTTTADTQSNPGIAKGLTQKTINDTDSGQIDFSAALLKAKQVNPDGIFAHSNEDESARILRELKKQGWTKPVIGETTLTDQKVIELAGDAANGAIAHVGLTVDAPIPASRSFKAKVEQEYKYVSVHNGMKGYSGVDVLKAAIENAGKLDRKAVAMKGLKVNGDKYPGALMYAEYDNMGVPTPVAPKAALKSDLKVQGSSRSWLPGPDDMHHPATCSATA